jgi:tetraacyldisaccharide 4'-kinase
VKPAHGLWLHLLDDGFQHRNLARDFDIVIVQPSDAAEKLLPDGRLREPLASLARADAIVLTEGATADNLPITKQHVWRVTRRIDLDVLPQPRPVRPLALCAIARPERFTLDLKAAGIEPVAQSIFADHHYFTAQDVASILNQAKKNDAECILTTEKDYVRLAPFRAEIEKSLRIFAIPLVMELIDPKNVMDIILGTVAERLRCRSAG